MWKVARRPKWIAVLVLCLAVAAGFALLGQWQLERSFDQAVIVERDTETAVPIERLTLPQQATTEAEAGHIVTVEGTFVEGDFVTLTDRMQHGDAGRWLVGHLRTPTGESLAVAIGWAAADGAAFTGVERALVASGAVAIEGRYLPSDSPEQSDFVGGHRSALATAELVNLWNDPGPIYNGYVVSHDDLGLELIDSPMPDSEIQLNWLNIFYAIEWALFAIFAVYLWYRLVRDAWEREVELAALAEESPETATVG